MLKFLMLLLMSTTAIAAEPLCGPRQEITKMLAAKDAAPLMGGLSDKKDGGQSVVELWAAPDGHWAAVVTQSDGSSCIVAAGHDFRAIPRKLDSKHDI